MPPSSLALLRAAAAASFVIVSASCGTDSTSPSASVVASVIVTASRNNADVGKSIQLSAIALDDHGLPVSGVTFVWSSSSTSIATVTSSGVVTGVALGTATITAAAGAVAGSIDIVIGPVMTTDRIPNLSPYG
jgi:uncharacterized protein YjdB